MTERELPIDAEGNPLQRQPATVLDQDALIRKTIIEALRRTTKTTRKSKPGEFDETQLLAALNPDMESRTFDLVEVVLDLEEAMGNGEKESNQPSDVEEEIVALAEKEVATVGEVIATAQRLLRRVATERRTA